MYKKIKSKFNIFFLSILFIVLITSIVVYAISLPTVTFTSPTTYRYFVPDRNDLLIKATITQYPTSVKYYYNNVEKGSLSLYASPDIYAAIWRPVAGTTAALTSDWVKGTLKSTLGQYWWDMPKLKVAGTNTSGTGYSEINTYISHGNILYYRQGDTNFYYNTPEDNLFIDVATGSYPVAHNTAGTYNCLAYSVDILNMWQWPTSWGSDPNAISISTIADYMKDTYREGANYFNATTTYTAFTTKVIYYSGGHFAKVVAYDSTGKPSKVRSKWSCDEVIESRSFDPFTAATYGAPKYFFY